VSHHVEALIEAREQTLARVRELLIRGLKVQRDPDELDPDTPLFGTGLGLDSVDAVELVVAVESAFKLKMPARALGPAAMRTINTLVDFILEHGTHDRAA
jgi:acyl carrier protein